MDLSQRWNDLLPDGAELGIELTGRYRDTDRRAYRDRYLAGALDAADDLAQLATDPVAVRLAVWFHRAVHTRDATAADDAEASARLAEERLPSYDVSPARVAEVARLVRLTGSASGPDQGDANGVVVHDAVLAVAGSAPATYRTHADDVRRDRAEQDAKQRYAQVQRLLSTGIYRTPLARERMERAARENLEHELAQLDEQLPAPWRGWQRAGLRALAVFAGLAATLMAVGGAMSPWHEPQGDGLGGLTILVLLAGIGLTAELYRMSGRADRPARTRIAAVAALAIVVLAGSWLKKPEVNPVLGIGLRVPLFLAAAVFLLIAAGAAFGAGLPRTDRYVPARNRGQVLAWLGAAAVVVLLCVYGVDPLAQRYVLTANEEVTGSAVPGGPAPATTLDGTVLWQVGRREAVGLSDAVATPHGIAVPTRSGGVLMLDGRTGAERWTYQRSDVQDPPGLFVIGGDRLLVRWEHERDLVLDAETGRRVAAWQGTADFDIDKDDPLLAGQAVSKGSDKLRGLDPDGKARWTYEPGRCTSISAAAAAGTVVTFLDHECGTASDQLVGLDLKTGKKLWSTDTPDRPAGPVAAGDVIVLSEGPESSGVQELVAIDPRTRAERWRAHAPAAECGYPRSVGALVVLTCGKASAIRFAAFDARRGTTAWQYTADKLGSLNRQYAVTESGALFVRPHGDGCRVVRVDRSGTRQVEIHGRAVTGKSYCDYQLRAFGDLIVVDTEDGAIALR